MKDMKQSRKTRYTQKALKDSLIELLGERPISKITIRSICERADVHRTTFYKHYADQYQLLKSVEDETLAWVGQAVAEFSGQMDRQDFLGSLEKVFAYIIENKNHIQVLMSERGNIGFQRNLMALLYAQWGAWPAGQTGGAASAKNELASVFLVNGSVGLIQHWLKTGLEASAGQMAEILCHMTYTAQSAP